MPPKRVSSFELPADPLPGRESFLLAVNGPDESASVDVGVNVLSGDEPGPTLLCIAGIHGDETNGVHALMKLWAELEPDDVHGRLVIVPVANPCAFRARQRRTPVDDEDLNRAFPGDTHGSSTQRLAAALTRSLVSPAVDFAFSLHSWYEFGMVMPYVEISGPDMLTGRQSSQAASACGFDIIRADGWQKGVFSQTVSEAGIPAMEAEIGGLGVTQEVYAGLYVDRTRRLMQFLGMLKAQVQGVPRVPRFVRHTDIHSPAAGVLDVRVSLGETVEEGGSMATLVGLDGRINHEIFCPTHATVAALRMTASVETGEHLFRLFHDVPNPFPS